MPHKHTPGEWEIEPDGMHPLSSRRVIKGGPPGRRVSLIIVDDWTKEADAVLMATAPKLLEACEEALRDIRSGGKVRAEKLIAAITQATQPIEQTRRR